MIPFRIFLLLSILCVKYCMEQCRRNTKLLKCIVSSHSILYCEAVIHVRVRVLPVGMLSVAVKNAFPFCLMFCVGSLPPPF